MVYVNFWTKANKQKTGSEISANLRLWLIVIVRPHVSQNKLWQNTSMNGLKRLPRLSPLIYIFVQRCQGGVETKTEDRRKKVCKYTGRTNKGKLDEKSVRFCQHSLNICVSMDEEKVEKKTTEYTKKDEKEGCRTGGEEYGMSHTEPRKKKVRTGRRNKSVAD